MLKFVLGNIMQHYAPAFIAVCVLLCLSFNYTFPLHRETKEWNSLDSDSNGSQRCGSNHLEITDWTKRTVYSAQNTLKNNKNLRKLRTTSYTFNVGPKEKNKLSDIDLRQYEQLVIMKKYPYLDLKELELKYRPSPGKNVRQNMKFAPERGFANEQGICEPIEDGPNVEIFNRGLSGFAIPHLTRVGMDKGKVTDTRHAEEKQTKKSQILDSLRDDVKEFEEKINSKLSV